MTESPDAKAKRGFLRYMQEYYWEHQISIFYKDYPSTFNANTGFAVIRRKIAREYPKTAFLWRIVLSRTNVEWIERYNGTARTTEMPYMTLFFTRNNEKVMAEDVWDIAESAQVSASEMYVKKRRLTIDRRDKIIAGIKNGKPHNLKKFFGKDTKINRYGLFGEKYAVTNTDYLELLR